MKKVYSIALGAIISLTIVNQYGIAGKYSTTVTEKTCTAIQNAINNAATGTTINLVSGDYICTSNINTKGKSTDIVGSTSTKLIAQGNIGGLIYDYSSASGTIKVSNITFDVNNQSSVSGISTGPAQKIILNNIKVINCKNIWCVKVGEIGPVSEFTMTNSTIGTSTNSTYESVLAVNVKNCLIKNNTFNNLTQAPAALALYVYSKNCVIKNNYFTDNTIRDFYSSGADHFLYDSNISTPKATTTITAHGVQIFNTTFATFSNNVMTGQNNGSDAGGGFLIYDWAVALDGHPIEQWATTTDITIINNKIIKSYVGVSMNCVSGGDKHYEKRNIVIKNNTIVDPLWKAIDIGCPNQAGKMTNIEITGNIATGTTRVFDGGNFSVTGQASSSISGVIIKKNTGLRSSAGGDSSCIYLSGVSNVTITGNNCTGVNKGSFAPIQVNANTTANIIIN
jgi:hypothetical protein